MSINPLLLDLPMPIRTPRLLISAPDPAYAEKLHDAKLRSLPQLKEWMTWAADDPKLGEEKTTLRNALARFVLRDNFMLLAFTHEGEFVAATGFPRINWAVPRCEIGYWCDTRMQGQGYVTEIVDALTRYGFDVLKMRKITLDIDAENHKSLAVAKRLNFIEEYRDLGGIVKPGSAELRTRVVTACYDPSTLPPLDVNW